MLAPHAIVPTARTLAQFSAYASVARRLREAPQNGRLRASPGPGLPPALLNLRRQLSSAFPETRFTVTAIPSGGCSVLWQAGPSEPRVAAVAQPYRGDSEGLHAAAWRDTYGTLSSLDLRRVITPDLVTRTVDRIFGSFPSYLSGVDRPDADDFFCGRLAFTVINVPEGRPVDLQQFIRERSREIDA